MTRIWIAGAFVVGLFATSAAACPSNMVREYNPENNTDECMNPKQAQETRDRRFAEEQRARAQQNQMRRWELDEVRLQHRRRAQQSQQTRTLRLLREQRARTR